MAKEIRWSLRADQDRIDIFRYWTNRNKSVAYSIKLNKLFIESLEEIKMLKNSEGPDIHVWGSSELIQLLLKNDLVDEINLKIYPLTLGEGKKLVSGGAIPASFKLTESIVTPTGVIIANYKRSGEVKTGNAGE